MFDAYMDLPAWLRTTLALIVLGLGLTLALVGYANRPQRTEQPLPDGRTMITETETRGAGNAFRAGLVITVVGALLFATCGKSKAEKSGYNF